MDAQRPPLPALAPGHTRVLYVRRWPLREGHPLLAAYAFGVSGADIAPDGTVTDVAFSWAGPAIPETSARIVEEAASIGAAGIVANLGAGRAGPLVPLTELVAGRFVPLREVPARPFAAGSLPHGTPNPWPAA